MLTYAEEADSFLPDLVLTAVEEVVGNGRPTDSEYVVAGEEDSFLTGSDSAGVLEEGIGCLMEATEGLGLPGGLDRIAFGSPEGTSEAAPGTAVEEGEDKL